ncbi:MAG: LamG domain-containing protein [Gammaproteobacteria bacterium]|nr:LamG domain-containing protein [Gammaproteobacteria bacterium]
MYKSILNRDNKPALTQRIYKSGPSFLLTAILLTGLTACGGGSNTESNAENGSGNLGSPVYTGPAPRNAQVQGYQTHVWDRLRGENVCGRCHRSDSPTSQTPYFVDWLDVNNAFDAMSAYTPRDGSKFIDLSSPKDSYLVTKVLQGHNCWLGSNEACATLITSYIDNWVGSDNAAEGRLIDLTPPAERPPGTTKFFPDFADAGTAYTSIHALLTEHCSGCHVSTAPTPQAPYFADPSPAVSYEAVQTKIDLMDPGNSRLVVRLSPERHQCWSDCTANATEMRTLIENFANPIPEISVSNPDEVSRASSLNADDAVVASGGNRFEAYEIARYEFRTGQGTTIVDTSPVAPALNLELQGTPSTPGTRDGDYRWLSTYGVEFIEGNGRAQASVEDSRKLKDLIAINGEYSIEAWVIPENVTQEMANIISYSAGGESTDRNFSLSQTMYNYDFRQMSSTTTDPDDGVLSTNADDERAQTTLQHVVVTFSPTEGRKIYVNGEFTGDADPAAPGTLTDWNEDFALVFGGESGGGGNREWLGTLRMVSIHNRALTDAQVQQNFAADVGQKFYLLFGISHLIDVPQAFIMFSVSQFDDYSYLFTQPRFISLDSSVDGSSLNIPLRGMRIGINANLAETGQAYATLDTTLGGDAYIAGEGQLLSPVGTIIELKRGQAEDDFYLSFENLDGSGVPFDDVTSDENDIPPFPTLSPAEKKSDIGVRTFEEINVAMSLMTGVPRAVLLEEDEVITEPLDLNEVYTTYYQQLPAVESIDAFLNSHQMAISQLALNYCNDLVNNSTAASAYFPGFNFGSAPSSAFTATNPLITDPLLVNMMNVDLSDSNNNLLTQPTQNEAEDEINNLIGRMTSCGAACDTTERTTQVVKASCAAVLGSAVMLIQ